MSDERWQRLWDAFHAALDEPSASRESIITERCADDDELKREALAMLSAHDRASAFIEPRLVSQRAFLPADVTPTLSRYIIEKKLGEGGFADVYLAEQLEPVKRHVALKVLKPGMDSRRIIARFQAEQQVLATLDHPGIAKVFDAGLTDQGRPYFAMEYIEGRPIVDFARDQDLSLRQRLELFQQVCAAVQHAHHKGVIHRDLKPGNILVITNGPTPVPKVIDFGVSKAIAGEGFAGTVVTEAGEFIGTPEYMSPEQAAGRTHDLDTRTDVYGLGVVLYELLTGTLPFEAATLRKAALAEVQRIICEVEPPKPSTRIRKSKLSSVQSPNEKRKRSSAFGLWTFGRLDFPGDLDWIVMKSLEKDRERRYDSPGAMAADIQRHLADQPVLAGPPSAMYQVSKFVRRHRAAVIAAGLMLLLLVGGAAATTWQAIRATRSSELYRLSDLANQKLAQSEMELRKVADERADEAEKQRRIAQAIALFLNRDILAAADPRGAGRPNITLREAVDAASANVGDRFKDDPLVEAGIRRVLGDVYRSLGEALEALPHLERARELYDAEVNRDQARDNPAALTALTPNHRALLGASNDLALLYTKLGKTDQAEKIFLEGIEIRRQVLGSEHRETIAATINLGSNYRAAGRLADAERTLLECIEVMERVMKAPAKDDDVGAGVRRDVSSSTGTLSFNASYNNLPPSMNDLMVTKQHLAGVYLDAKRPAEVEPLAREIIAYHQQTKGEDHPYTLSAMNSLALAFVEMNRTEDAVELYHRVLEASRRRMGAEHPDAAAAMANLADAERKLGHYDRAIELLSDARAIVQKSLGEAHPLIWTFLNLLGLVYEDQERGDLAEPLYAQAAAGARQHLPAGHWSTGLYLLNHGKCLNRLQRWSEAEPRLLEAQEILLKALGPKHEHSLASFDALALMYTETGRDDLARQQQARKDESLNPEDQ